MTKIQTPEQFAALGQANLESLMSLAGSAIARAERLAELNLNTVRSVLEDSMATTKKLAEAKNPQDLASLQTELTKPLSDLRDVGRNVQSEVASVGASMTKPGVPPKPGVQSANADVNAETVRIMGEAELGAEQPALGVDVAHASTRTVTVEPRA